MVLPVEAGWLGALPCSVAAWAAGHLSDAMLACNAERSAERGGEACAVICQCCDAEAVGARVHQGSHIGAHGGRCTALHQCCIKLGFRVLGFRVRV